MSNQFNIMRWSDSIPLTDDLWLGMQARNIAIVDLSVIREVEAKALAAYMEDEKTPIEILLTLSALSQMWIFSLFEFLRTWRQRAQELIEIADAYTVLPTGDQAPFLAKAVSKAEEKERLIRVAVSFYAEHVAKISDPKFVKDLRGYLNVSEKLFRSAEAIRVTLAKHEVPKGRGLVAEAPGYGRMSYRDGSIYWFVKLKDGSQIQVDRRELSSAFLGIDDDQI